MIVQIPGGKGIKGSEYLLGLIGEIGGGCGGFCEIDTEKAAFTVEYPWGFVHENHAETLGVIRLETSYHEFNRGVILFYQLHALADNERKYFLPCSPLRSQSYQKQWPG